MEVVKARKTQMEFKSVTQPKQGNLQGASDLVEDPGMVLHMSLSSCIHSNFNRSLSIKAAFSYLCVAQARNQNKKPLRRKVVYLTKVATW